LFKSKRIKPNRPDQNEITQLLQLAKRDLNTAKRNLDDAPDWAYSIAYNPILQAGRALMFFTGYRPRGSEQHSTVVEFLEERLGSTFEGQVHLPTNEKVLGGAFYLQSVCEIVSQTQQPQSAAVRRLGLNPNRTR
jgi:hypothetical protein